MKYKAPWWLPGGQAQTIWPALFSKRTNGAAPVYVRERWNTPDGDFVDVDFSSAAAQSQAPLLVLFHGLEGSSASHYAQAFASWCKELAYDFAVPHFRGCSGEINRAPRAYHSGDYAEIAWILSRMRAQNPLKRIVAVGVSLGGNALLRWAQEAGQTASGLVSAVASVCSPIDLAASGHAIGQGFNRLVYTRMFLRSMKPKALERLALHPGLFDREALMASKDLYAFDNIFTAPLHGFKDTNDYWSRASAKPHLGRIQIPALILNAQNDRFVPFASLPQHCENTSITLWQPRHGGHVGFPQGALPVGDVFALPREVGAWLMRA